MTDHHGPSVPPKPPLPTSDDAWSPEPRQRVGGRAPRILLTLYAIAVGLLLLWPESLDIPAGGFLQRMMFASGWLTAPRLEFGANVLLFVPLGVLLTLVLEHRHLVLPIAIVISTGVEATQALVLSERTPTVLDIVANVTGACIGLLIVAVVDWIRARRMRR